MSPIHWVAGVAHMDMTDAQNNLPKDQHQKWISLAIEDLGRAIKADPRLKEARTNLAIAYSTEQRSVSVLYRIGNHSQVSRHAPGHRTGEAIAQLDSAIELAPDYINAYSLRARTLAKCTPGRCAEHPRLGDWPCVLTWCGQNWQL